MGVVVCSTCANSRNANVGIKARNRCIFIDFPAVLNWISKGDGIPPLCVEIFFNLIGRILVAGFFFVCVVVVGLLGF